MYRYIFFAELQFIKEININRHSSKDATLTAFTNLGTARKINFQINSRQTAIMTKYGPNQ